MKRNNKKGFTIVELVIVIAVIAILSAVLIPTFGGIIDQANASKVQQELNNAYKNHLITALSDGVCEGDELTIEVDDITITLDKTGTITNVVDSSNTYDIEHNGGAITSVTTK